MRFVRLAFVVVALLASYVFASQHFAHSVRFAGANLEKLTEGTALVPYQFRVLVPWLAKLVSGLSFHDLPLGAVYFAFEVIGVFLTLLAFRKYLALLLRNTDLASWLALTILYPLAMTYVIWDAYPIYYYPYDIPSVLFTTLGLVFLYEKSWAKYYVLFVVATFNRETTCFLTIVFVATSFGKRSTRDLLAHSSAQLAIWLMVKALLYQQFGTNPSASVSVAGLFDANVPQNLQRLSSPGAALSLLSICGFLWLPTVLGARRIRDDFARRSLLVCLPFFAGMLLVGNILEIRIFGELIPIVLSGFLLVLTSYTDALSSLLDRRRGDRPRHREAPCRGDISCLQNNEAR